MTTRDGLVDAHAVLMRVASRVPAALREHLVIVGSIAAALAFPKLAGGRVRTKDIDVLLRPSVAAVVTAQDLSAKLLSEGWTPHYPDDWVAADESTQEQDLPVLRLKAPGEKEGWFLELMAAPEPAQEKRKEFREVRTNAGRFALPSYRFLPATIFGAELWRDVGVRVAVPASMAFGNLLEHSVPDTNTFKDGGELPRFAKDVGRAVSLYWMAEQNVDADLDWTQQIRTCVLAVFPHRKASDVLEDAMQGLRTIDDVMRQTHEHASQRLIASFPVPLEGFRQSWARLLQTLGDLKRSFDSVRS